MSDSTKTGNDPPDSLKFEAKNQSVSQAQNFPGSPTYKQFVLILAWFERLRLVYQPQEESPGMYNTEGGAQNG